MLYAEAQMALVTFFNVLVPSIVGYDRDTGMMNNNGE